jgi:Domain of Unknown Function (DUF1206)
VSSATRTRAWLRIGLSRRSRVPEALYRLGFAAKGMLYALIAVIALRVAIGGGGSPEDQEGALLALRDEPFGSGLLVLLALGLSGYALWALVELVRGPESDGVMAVLERIGALVRALIYGALAAFAFSVGFGSRSGEGGSQPRELTERALAVPWGRWLVCAVGVVIVAVAGYDAYRAISRNFADDLTREPPRATRRWILRLGSAGFASRAVAYGLVGAFVVKAAIEYDPNEAVGLDGALQRLAAQPYGMALLGLVAAGLFCYALYAFAEARYHKLETS